MFRTLLVCFTLLCMSGCGGDPWRPGANAEVVKMKVGEFYKTLEGLDGSEAAAEKYRGKWLELEGQAFEVGLRSTDAKDEVHQAFVLLRDDEGGAIVHSLRPDPWKEISAGCQVRARGALFPDGALHLCQWTLLKGEPARETTVEELAALFFERKEQCPLHDHQVLVRGKLAKKFGAETGELQGSQGGTLVLSGFGGTNGPWQKVQVGNDVTLLGTAFYQTEGQPRLELRSISLIGR